MIKKLIFIIICFVSLLLWFFEFDGWAAEYTIDLSAETTVDGGANGSGIGRCHASWPGTKGVCQSGDTLILDMDGESAVGRLALENFDGSPGYITIKNEATDRVVIEHSADSASVLSIDDSSYIKILGNNKSDFDWVDGCTDASCYGIKVVYDDSPATDPSTTVWIHGESHHIQISYIEVAITAGGTTLAPSGMSIHATDGEITGGLDKTYIYKTIELDHNYIHDVKYSCMYLGHSNPSVEDTPYLEDILVHHNICENAGNYGMLLKGIGPNNTLSAIYNNKILPTDRDTGYSTGSVGTSWDLGRCGIIVNFVYDEVLKIYNNWVEKTMGCGITPNRREISNVEVFNNVIVGCGDGSTVGRTAWDSGTTYALKDRVTHSGRNWDSIHADNFNNIPSDASDDWIDSGVGILVTDYGETLNTVGDIYNNTIVKSGSNGIYVQETSVTGGTYYDNLIVEPGANYYAGDADYSAGTGDYANTEVADADNVGFVTWSDDDNYSNDDFDLAVGHSVDIMGDEVLTTDYDGNSRATFTDGAYDSQSAYYNSNQGVIFQGVIR